MASNKNNIGGVDKILSSIKKLVYGDTIKTDAVMNNTISNVIEKTVEDSSVSLKDFITTGLNKISSDPQLFGDISLNNIMIHQQELTPRIARYINADEITETVPYCARALNVISDEIISPNDFTKESLSISVEEDPENKIKDKLDIINDKISIEDNIHSIVKETLKYGDQFLEIVHTKDKTAPLLDVMITESEGEIEDSLIERTIKYVSGTVDAEIPSDSRISENSYSADRIIERNVTINLTCFREEESNKEDLDRLENKSKKKKNSNKSLNSNDKKVNNLDDVKLIIHDPKTVIKLQSKRFRYCLGYLVFPRNLILSNLAGFGTSNSNGFPMNQSTSLLGTSNNIRSALDTLYTKMLSKLERYLNSKDNDIDEENKGDLKNILTQIIRQANEDKIAMDIRFVPPEKMEHFVINDKKFFPYGEHIFFKSIFNAKLLVALETAVTIKRISDSSEKRIIKIDSTIPRNSRNLIEELKETFNKRRFSIDSVGSISSIPSSITTFEDIYIPMKNGKSYIEFDRLEPKANLRDIHEELKFFRDMIVTGLDVPPSFLNIEENLSNKSALSQENVIFARNITSYQKIFSKSLTSLFKKLHILIYKEPLLAKFKVLFPPPKSLLIEYDSEKMNLISQIATAVEPFDIPKEYIKTKYLSDLDWDEIEKAKLKEDLNKNLKPNPTDQTPGGGGY